MCAGLIATALGLASFSLAGLYCNHADLSPRYAPVLLGLTNTSGAVPGIVGVAVTGRNPELLSTHMVFAGVFVAGVCVHGFSFPGRTANSTEYIGMFGYLTWCQMKSF